MAIPPLLFIHGSANGAWVWDNWRAYLMAKGHTAVVIDLRGHGKSMPADFTVMTMDDYVADLESVVPQVEAHYGMHPIIGGWDMGGLVAMMYAARHPETPGLVLFAPFPPVEVGGRADPDVVRATPTTAYGPDFYGIFPDDLERSRPALFDLTDEEAGRVLTNSAGAQESGFARRQRLRGISVDAAAIAGPSIVIFGEEDAVIPPEQSQGVAAFLGSEVIAVPAVGHWGPIAHKPSVSALSEQLDAWLQRCFSEPGN